MREPEKDETQTAAQTFPGEPLTCMIHQFEFRQRPWLRPNRRVCGSRICVPGGLDHKDRAAGECQHHKKDGQIIQRYAHGADILTYLCATAN